MSAFRNNHIDKFTAKSFENNLLSIHFIKANLIETKYNGLNAGNEEYIYHIKVNEISHFGYFIFRDNIAVIDNMVNIFSNNFKYRHISIFSKNWSTQHSKILANNLVKKYNLSGSDEQFEDITFNYGIDKVVKVVEDYVNDLGLDRNDVSNTYAIWQFALDYFDEDEFYSRLNNA